MKTKRITYPIAALMIVILAACNLPQASATEKPLSVEAAFTAAAQTVEAQLTGAAQTQAASGAPTATPTPSNTSQPAAASSTPTLPAASVTPTAISITATSTQGCDQAQFITDVTVEDGSNFSAGDTFVKTWRIKNTGSCSWTPSYTLFFSSGSQMNGPSSVALTGNVNPGQSVDISVNLTAPASSGDYTGYWKLRNAADLAFTSMYVKISVGGSSGGAFAVTHVDFSSSGGCGTFNVTAKITASAAGTVTYHWVWSDGSTDGTVHDPLVFSAAGIQSVSTTWTTSAPGAKWIDIYIDEPNHQQFGRANFSCP